jgi:hypothetical protein
VLQRERYERLQSRRGKASAEELLAIASVPPPNIPISTTPHSSMTNARASKIVQRAYALRQQAFPNQSLQRPEQS